MVRKIILSILGTLGIGILLFLVFQNLDSFVATTNRLSDILKIDSLKNFFEVYNESSKVIYDESVNEIVDAVGGVIDSFQQTVDRPFEEILAEVLLNLLDFGLDFFIYFCNYGLNAILITYILLHETFAGEQLTIKTSPLGFLWIRFNNFIDLIKNSIIRGFRWFLNLLSEYKKVIVLSIFLILCANGFMYRFLVEFLIFFITYVIRMVNLETYIVIFQIVQTVFTFLYPKLKLVPLWIWIPTLVVCIFFNAVARAKYKLKKNHERLKDFAKDELTQTTFINGPPGTGKTLLNVSLTLASEENYIEELEKKLLDYEMNYKYLNFAKVRSNPEEFPEHQEYINTYKLLTSRGTFVISNYAIYSPLFNEYSKIFNFDYMRVNIPTDTYPLEEYIVISISEFDKEYNSHDDKKAVGEDGAHTFFSTTSHNLKRHTKIFVDYQLKDQVPLRIRGNSEYFITIKKREKKYPIILMLYYLPFRLMHKITRYYIKKYELRKQKITKTSMRKGQATYKRNDLTLPYIMLRNLATSLKRVCDWFDSFYYFKLTTYLSQEGDVKGNKKKLCINIRDLSYNGQNLYDSTFLSYAYEQKKNRDFKDLPRFTRLTPPIEELNECNSKFYNKINSQF